MVQQVPENITFPKEEEKILELWKNLNCFQECLKQSKNRPRFNFYDGPPFATGLPHYGHILAGTIKDIVTRFAHQSGFHVDRRFGWDCHGLPVEYEIDKTLGIKGPEDVAKMGIEEYNNQCRGIVMRYSKEWEFSVTRLGRWIDFENDYKTLYPEFMESVWWVFKQLYDKGLVYRGVKVMPFSTACNTPLSNFESHQNYKCKDKGAFAVVVDNYVKEEEGTGVVHQAPYFGADDYRVCMDFNIIQKDSVPVCPVDASGCFTAEVTDFAGQYVKVSGLEETGKSRLALECQVGGSAQRPGKSLPSQIGNFVEVEGGLHVQVSMGLQCSKLTPFVSEATFALKLVFINLICQLLTPDRAWYQFIVPPFFLQYIKTMVPDFVREKRFGNWLKDARDWAISRNRYWGTPIPLWVSEDFEETVYHFKLSNLNDFVSGEFVNLFLSYSIDHLTIPSRCGKGLLRRVPEVFDCWFESGSMPYAQVHYPFENKKELEDAFPADFIAEGIDQTRGCKMQGILKFGDKYVTERRHVIKQSFQLLWKTSLGDRGDLWPGQEESQHLNFQRT
ncbi:isoleucine--trna cytoplasmic [Limosa lapponica baueri]|uniref:isoleucine--tRNA ligase n=1 Tax=Limosa lapponica baueri TaxID=1758121 RepID=A0A2I0TRE3_LIMLA|nr:isoleucine--trna cytoplasmic [Limosa lapponica baueri]